MKLLLVSCTIFAAALAAPNTYTRTINNRVVGGENAHEGEFPYQVTLQWGIFGIFQHVCGGSIIAEQWILTAGHCVTELPLQGDMDIVAGITNLEDIRDGQRIRVVERIVHAEYPGGVAVHDIALLKLKSPLVLNDKVKIISLPEAGTIPSGDTMLSGWGSTSNTIFPIMPSQLQKAELPIVPFDECKQRLIDIMDEPGPLATTNVCTGSKKGGQSACSGDSGGPIAQDGKVIGIASWAIMPCGRENAPSVFTRVSHYLDWIATYVK